MKRFILITAVILFCACAPSPALAAGTLTCERFGTSFFALEERKVAMTIDEGIIFAEIEDSFSNDFEERTEGIYKFDLPENAIPCGFEMMTDGREWISGKAMDLRKAKLIYQEIVRISADPGLMTIKNSELKIRIFPIEKKLPVKVRFRFMAAMNSGEFLLPVEKHRVPGSGGDMNEINRAGTKKPAAGSKISVFISARDSGNITKLEYAGLSGTCENRIFKLTASASRLPDEPEKVILTRASYSRPGKARAFKSDDKTATAVVTVDPSVYPDARCDEADAVIDASGSMGNNNKKRAVRFLGALSKCFTGLKYSIVKEGGISKAATLADVEKADFFGGDPSDMKAHIASISGGSGPIFLLTDGVWLDPLTIQNIQKTAGVRKVILILFDRDPDRGLIRAAGKNGRAARYSELEKAGLPLESIRKLGGGKNVFIKSGDFIIPPLFTDPTGEGGLSVFAVKFDEKTKETYHIVDSSGAALGDIGPAEGPIPALNSDMPKKLLAAAAVRTLESGGQTDEAIADIVKLGVENGLVTAYTAYIAVPPSEAGRNSDVMNPAFLAAFAAPNFNRSRSQAKVKSCVANMKTIEGAIELYAMENGPVPDPDPKTLAIPLELFKEKGYLKSVPKCPAAYDGNYRMLKDRNREGVSGCEIFCEAHGFLSNFEMPGQKPAEDQFMDKCNEYGLSPAEYSIKFLAAEGLGGSEVLEEWLRRNFILLYIIDAFLN